jgi:hypothetical protein
MMKAICLLVLLPTQTAGDMTTLNAVTMHTYNVLQQLALVDPSKLDFAEYFALFSPKMDILSFPEGPHAMLLTKVPFMTGFPQLVAGHMLTKYKIIPEGCKLLAEAVNGTQGFSMYTMELCGLAADGGCIPDTTVLTNDIVKFDFDENNKITGFQDWWQPQTMKKLDALIAASEAKKATSLSLAVSTQLVEQPLATSFVACVALSALVVGSYLLGVKRGRSISSGEGYKILLEA